MKSIKILTFNIILFICIYVFYYNSVIIVGEYNGNVYIIMMVEYGYYYIVNVGYIYFKWYYDNIIILCGDIRW